MAVGVQAFAADKEILMRTVEPVIPAVVPGRINEIAAAAGGDHVPAVVQFITADKVRLDIQSLHKVIEGKGISLTDRGSFDQGIIGIIAGQGIVIFYMGDQPVMDIQNLLLVIPAAVNTGQRQIRFFFESGRILCRIITDIGRIESRHIAADTGVFILCIHIEIPGVVIDQAGIICAHIDCLDMAGGQIYRLLPAFDRRPEQGVHLSDIFCIGKSRLQILHAAVNDLFLLIHGVNIRNVSRPAVFSL